MAKEVRVELSANIKAYVAGMQAAARHERRNGK